jgi:hypothetical protein
MNRFLSRSTRTGLTALITLTLMLAACSGSDDAGDFATTMAAAGEAPESGSVELVADGSGDEADRFALAGEDGVVAVSAIPVDSNLRIIRDGRVDMRIEAGTFGQSAASLRTLAEDLGGYLAGGETHLEEIDDVKYTVGWYTLRVPEERFEEALSRVEGMGERLALTVSSQDVTEEYVDLEGRLRYWRNQEAFYTRLLDEAETIDDLVRIQSQMQEVLLNIEQIEGRLRYLDSRTSFSTLTVGLTEVPGATPLAPVDPDEPGILTQALEQAGLVLLNTIGFLIVAAAFLLPLAIVAGIGLAVWRGVSGGRRKDEPAPAAGD